MPEAAKSGVKSKRRPRRDAGDVAGAEMNDAHASRGRFNFPITRRDEISLAALGRLAGAENVSEDDVQAFSAFNFFNEAAFIGHHELDVVAIRYERQGGDVADNLAAIAAVEANVVVIFRVEGNDSLGALVVQRDPAGDVLRVFAIFDVELERH